jgi:hypothetical protein
MRIRPCSTSPNTYTDIYLFNLSLTICAYHQFYHPQQVQSKISSSINLRQQADSELKSTSRCISPQNIRPGENFPTLLGSFAFSSGKNCYQSVGLLTFPSHGKGVSVSSPQVVNSLTKSEGSCTAIASSPSTFAPVLYRRLTSPLANHRSSTFRISWGPTRFFILDSTELVRTRLVTCLAGSGYLIGS